MTTSRTLQPEDEIAQYRVVGPIGAGGMGEVYLAQDRTLERNVALKVLPPDVVRNEDRVRRFQQEAKSASSLNHPNIVTIYEIGQDSVKSGSGTESGSGPLHYISMELISGRTLASKIHEEKTDLRTLLGYMAQAAEGIAKAHAAGIVHRDLKPGNIMVSDDGFAKVLDFGLAKLTEKSLHASPTEATEIADRTSEGTILGTVHYMAPEQVQGKTVDTRSDIFSFGCILYEAATRRRPFVADSNVETMHKILNEKPAPIEDSNPEAPAELRRLIRRCLAKAPDQRLQSMKDLAIELREIVDEYEALSASATSGSGSMTGAAAVAATRGRRVPIVPIAIGALVIAAAGIGYGVWSSRRGGDETAGSFANVRFTTATTSGDVVDCSISPDGRYLAYLVRSAGHSGMFVKQIATGSDVPVLPVSDRVVESPVFSPDGNYLFFLARKPDAPLYRALYRMPSLGGAEEERAFDVDSRVSFSPDGEHVTFQRGVPQENRTAIVVLPAGGGTERDLASVVAPEVVNAGPVWSPDGKWIAVVIATPPPNAGSRIALFDAQSGERRDAFTRAQAFYTGLSWLGDGSGLVVTGSDLTMGLTRQVFLVSREGGRVSRITNDFHNYSVPSVSGGEETAAVLRGTFLTNLWSVDPSGGDVRQLTRASSQENAPWDFAAGADYIALTFIRDERARLFVQPANATEPTLVATGPGHVTSVMTGGDVMVIERYVDGAQHIWVVNKDGSGLRQLTAFNGEALAHLSPDGRYFTFQHTDSGQGIWAGRTDGGDPWLVSRTARQGAAFSPDGEWIMCAELEQTGELIDIDYRLYPSTGGDSKSVGKLPRRAIAIAWGSDSRSGTYIDRADPAWNVFRQSIDGGAPVQITRFTDHRVTGYVFSKSGTRLAVQRRSGMTSRVWVMDGDGSNPREVTGIQGETVFGMQWMGDERLIVSAGTSHSDAVLVRSFR